jgi:hypothetical protein
MDGPKDSDSVAAGGVVSREELFALVWAEPMLKVAKQFGVSSSYMARVCTSMNVPRPQRGYWARLAVGRTVRKPALPAARAGDVLSWGRGADLKNAPRSVPKAPAIESVPTRKSIRKHSGQHPLVYGAKALFEAGRLSRSSGYLKPNKKLLVDLNVSKTGLERALSFADALFWHFEDCGHRVVIAPEHEHFRRAAVDQHEVPKPKRDHYGYEYSELWKPGRPTIVYIGSLAIGLTIIELSELAAAKYVNGRYERLEIPVECGKASGSYGWPYTTNDFPTNRLCLQVYSPYPIADWTNQWREAKGEDLRKRIPGIIKELTEAAPEIVKLIEEGERQAAIRRQEWEEERRRWEREEAEKKAAEALKKSKQQLMDFIDTWGKAKRISAFLDEVAASLSFINDDLRPQFERRLERVKAMIGDSDALRGLRNWKTPEEWLAEEAAKPRFY